MDKIDFLKIKYNIADWFKMYLLNTGLFSNPTLLLKLNTDLNLTQRAARPGGGSQAGFQGWVASCLVTFEVSENYLHLHILYHALWSLMPRMHSRETGTRPSHFSHRIVRSRIILYIRGDSKNCNVTFSGLKEISQKALRLGHPIATSSDALRSYTPAMFFFTLAVKMEGSQ